MARPATCSVLPRAQKRGTRFVLRVSLDGERYWIPLGGTWEGWDEERAERERDLVATLLERGEWTPPEPAAPPTPPAAKEEVETFAMAASRSYAARSKRMESEKSKEDLRWRLGAAIQHLGERPVLEVDATAVDDMVTAFLDERALINEAKAAGKPLTRTVHDSKGRTYQRRRRGLSNTSINKVVGAVRTVLEDARRRGIATQPAVDRQSMVRAERPNRSYLQPKQLRAALDAAQAVEREGRGLDWPDIAVIRASDAPHTHLAARFGVSDTLIRKIRRNELWVERPEPRRNDIPRYALWALLVGIGVRIDEACGLEIDRHIDLEGRRISITRDITKTDAGVRTIPMLPFVHDAVADHLERRPRAACGRLFVTRIATPQTPDNVRMHVIDPVRTFANERGARIASCTPHTLRRTFASILAEAGVPPRRAMYLLGHTDAKFTMSVYQQVLDLDDTAMDVLEAVIGCTLDQVYATMVGRSARRLFAVA
jgi:integrase